MGYSLFYLKLFHETNYLLFDNEFRGFGYEIISGGGQWDTSIYTYMIDPGGLLDTPPPPTAGRGPFRSY